MKVRFCMIEAEACLNSAPKEQKRIAQGFSRGNGSISNPALQGRPSSLVITRDAIQTDHITPARNASRSDAGGPTLRYSNTPRPRIRARARGRARVRSGQ